MDNALTTRFGHKEREYRLLIIWANIFKDSYDHREEISKEWFPKIMLRALF